MPRSRVPYPSELQVDESHRRSDPGVREGTKGKTWLTASAAITAALALLPWPAPGTAEAGRGPTARHASQVERSCSGAERRRLLARDQRRVLARVGPLAVLRNQRDQAALAARGWSVPPHQYVSLRGMAVAFARTDFLTAPVEPGNPLLLFYAPSPDARNVTDPRGADFPYRLRGWAYVAPYDSHQHPTGLGPCVRRADWFVHERGVHTLDDGGMQAVPPREREEIHGTAPGSDPPPPSPTRPGFPHPRFWDVHVWLDGDRVPTVSMLNPGERIPGLDPHVGEWFFRPPPAAAGGKMFVQDDCHELIAVVPVPENRLAGQVPPRFRPLAHAGMANVTVRTASCERLGVEGRELRPGLVAQATVEVVSPDGRQNVDGFECCSWYILFWVTDNRDVAAWLRQGTGLATKVQYVKHLSLTYDRATGGAYVFRAGPPTPSPFEIHAVANVPAPRDHHIEFAYWAEKDGGAVKIHGMHDTLRFGAAAGVVLPQAGSALAQLIGERAIFAYPFGSNSIGSPGGYFKSFLPCGEQCFP